MKSLVGYTGFVGSNLASQVEFDRLYNSKNIQESFGSNPDLLVYSGVRAEMFLANSNPDADLALMEEAAENIKKINPKKLVLISTVAIYDKPLNVDESTIPNSEELLAYGKNRLYLEELVKNIVDDYLIVRLPAIYGENLKKNFIFDMITRTPALLTETKYQELCIKDDFIKKYYSKQENGFYKCIDSFACKNYFENIGFSALNFTDSRSIYQFYNLKYLWEHIEYAINNNIKVFNIATEPITAKELYEYIYLTEFSNELQKVPFNYNMKTKYFNNGYIFDKEFCLNDIKKFIKDRG